MMALPEAIRARIVALGSLALDGLGGDAIPAALRPIARFTPAKRGKLGGSAIAAVIDTDAGFRSKVLESASAAMPGMADALRTGAVPAAADPTDVAAMAYLLRPSGWEDIVKQAAQSVENAQVTAQTEREATVAARLREQLEVARTSARETRDRLKGEIDRLKDENTGLRRRLRETRDQLRAAEHDRDAARSAADEHHAEATRAQRSVDAEVRRQRSRVTELEEALGSQRRAGRGERDLGTARLALLLDTLGDVASGLRRELALPASAIRPADTVAAAEPSEVPDTGGARARSTDDPRLLDDLLALPRVHLIVDGYNVTKAAWASMPLEAQRSRLVQGLAALVARSGAEVTCVFDGADVSVPPSVTPAQGVRVRFSPEGTTADELIRQLVRAEPEGRPVVVVSSDREVADGVRRPGVRSVQSVALERLLR